MADAAEDALGFPPGAFARLDETDDALFYEPARLVQHIDDVAIAALTELYRTGLSAGGALLDRMGSWIKHLPPEIQYRDIDGRGKNAWGLTASPCLSRSLMQDRN